MKKDCELIKASKILFKQRFGQKNYLSQEQVTRNFAYASVVSKNIKKNEKLSRENITVKRLAQVSFQLIA